MSRPPSSQPLSPGEKWATGIILLALLGLFTAEIAIHYHPVKLTGLFVILFWVPLLVTHEAGHAIATRLLGWHLGRITLGFGRVWLRIERPSYFIEIRSFPVTGFVQCVPTHLRQPRLREALIYAAGPGTDFLVAALVLAIVGPARLFSESAEIGTLLCQSLALAAVAQGVLNLIPFPSFTPGKEQICDGLGILQAPFMKESHYVSLIEDFRRKGRAVFEGEPDEDRPRPPDPNEWWKQDRRL